MNAEGHSLKAEVERARADRESAMVEYKAILGAELADNQMPDARATQIRQALTRYEEASAAYIVAMQAFSNYALARVRNGWGTESE